MKKELTKYLRDYKRPDYLIPKVDLHFDIRVHFTVVTAMLHIKRNGRHKRPLVLNGEDLELLSVQIDGDPLKKRDYRLTDEELCINVLVDEFCLETRVRIKPHKNTRLEGLYKSNGNYFTQCEPHGFRRITYFIDRPDIMSEFTTKISAPESFKAVLSNGNVAKSVRKNKRVTVTWHDPSLKPCYLFALVVGNFDIERTVFVTKSGRNVDVRVYVEQGQKKRALYALESLVRAMHWDEDVFNREYDLDRYMIVAVSDFNVGAMENKGLNIFNSKYVLADSKTATDDDYINVASVVGHEYFHNWSGNRVTCRDWFQLSLKEGLTVFRDQEFTADITNPVVKRIGDVNIIRTLQFAEDAGPMAHPVQPRSYVEMNNFYTVTVYDKGAEIVRMLQTILGNKHFHDAMSLYFNSYDGKAITINEFISAMSVASGIDLTQFKKWYRYAGTPHLTVTDSYDERRKRYILTVRQDKNFHIPLAIGLLDKKHKRRKAVTQIFNIRKPIEKFVFDDVDFHPLPSLLRNFSAPVKLHYKYSFDDLLFMYLHDSDDFNRWSAGQQLAAEIIMRLIADFQAGKRLVVPTRYLEALLVLLRDQKIDKSFKALLLSLPTELAIIEALALVDVEAIYAVYTFVKEAIAVALYDELFKQYRLVNTHTTSLAYDAMGERKLKNTCLRLLVAGGGCDAVALAVKQFDSACCMTDTMGALQALNELDCPEREQLLARFYAKWQNDELVLTKWLELNALAKLPTTLQNLQAIVMGKDYDLKNPNKVYALLRSFSRSNYLIFNDISGDGYKFLADNILRLDPINPQVAAIITNPLLHWYKLDEGRSKLMRAQLKRIAKHKGLSKNVREVVTKGLVEKNAK